MKMQSLKNRKNGGFTLVELLIVIGVIAVLAAAIFANQLRATNASTTNRFVNDINLIVTQARVWKGVKTSYTGISLTVLTSMDLLDNTWGSGTGVNPAGGNYTVAVGSPSTRLTLTATGMDQTMCLNVENQIEAGTVGGNSASCTSGTLTATYQ